MRPPRYVARVIIIDAADSVLLYKYSEERSGAPISYWVPPGGALEPGENHGRAAVREIREETGLAVQIADELWERRVALQIQGQPVSQIERYFLARLGSVCPSVRNSSSEDIEELRWWSLPELAKSDELVYPEGLRDQLAELLAKGQGRGAV
jgi:8-oxo-dGTP pyrophosphatase MutT (NUDIX family)